MLKLNKVGYWALIVVFFLIDFLSKLWILKHFRYGHYAPVTEYFALVRWHNTGAAFGFLHQFPGWQNGFFLLVAFVSVVMFMKWLSEQPPEKAYVSFALSCLVAGALGNAYDRVVYGYVVDFILLHYKDYYFPAFNVADVMINLGVVIYILGVLKERYYGSTENH